ncbi:MAG: tail fiber domain-containing protein [Myxococcota bacterium]
MLLRRSTLPAFLVLLWTLPAYASDLTVTLSPNDGFVVKNSTGTTDRLRVEEATGNISRNGALFVHTTGTKSLFVGPSAGTLTASGLGRNTAFGHQALSSLTSGSVNTSAGYMALGSNTTGFANTAAGGEALRDNTTGFRNTAVGAAALKSNSTGSYNAAIGLLAGSNQTTGSNNIYLANTGLAGESGQIKIGTVGTHTGATFAGIHNATSTSGIAVLVNASGVLGTTTSSARFKRDIADMGNASDVLMQLRPVVFHYKEEAVGEEAASELQYGLVAEEVAEVAPELVAPGTDGKPYSVRYHVLPAMLLNEVQRQRREIAVHEQRDAEQERTIAALQARLARLEAREE